MNIRPTITRPRVVAIIQARMGSTRLPGKVLQPIVGKSLLWHIVERLKRCGTLDEIAIATTANPRDDAIAAFGREANLAVIRGSEDNVLARFAQAAQILRSDVIVRVSSDAPFIDAGFVDHLVRALIAQDGDYVLLEDGATTAHEGVDPFTRRALDRLLAEAHADPVAREHVTGYFKQHPDFVRIARAPAYPSLARESGRLTVDTPADLAFVEAAHARLNARAGEASLSDLLLLLEREPSLRALNAHVAQKTLAHAGGLALIRCDGGGKFGYGHVKRMLALASALRDSQGIGSVFALRGSVDAAVPIHRAGFAAVFLGDGDEFTALSKTIDARRPDLLICDMREGCGRNELTRLAARVGVTATVDDASARRLAGDIAYFPDLPQAHALSWDGSGCIPRIGWEWSLLGLRHLVPHRRSNASRRSLLVSMGGTDPTHLTLRMATTLAKLGSSLRVRFVIGTGVANSEQVARAVVARSPNFETVEGAHDLATEFAAADLALTAFGVTAYELASSGVPALYLSLTPDHAISAAAFQQAGMGISLGVASECSDAAVAAAICELASDVKAQRRMAAIGPKLIDGGGAARIAADLAAHLVRKRTASAQQIAI